MIRLLPRVLAVFALMGLALAHPLSGDGPVSGELKWGNSDIPIANKRLQGYLSFVSVNGLNVNLMDCFCRMLAYQGQASAQARPDVSVTFTPNPTTGRVESLVVFPKPGPYMVVVMGRALPGKNLPAFILTAIIVVEPG